MDSIVQKDLDQLMRDTEKIERGLGRLKQDYAAWARNREENDLVELAEDLKRAEVDLSMTLSDCAFVYYGAHGRDGARVAQSDLHQAFVYLNALFNDLKKAASELKEAYVYPGDLNHIEIDCGRFSKKIGQIQKHLKDEAE